MPRSLLGAALFVVAASAAPAPPPADYVGEQTCVGCHAAEGDHFGWTQHARIFRGNPRSARQERGCEACHGPGSRHLEDVTDRSALIGFTGRWGTPIEIQNGQCLACHEAGRRIHWPGSAHALNRVACADCHNPMARFSAAGLLRAAGISATCFSCHAQQRAEFRRRSHMPLPEGRISCSDCHAPHGSVTPPLLNADTVNTLCFGCHAEKRGPFVWEHAPVRENCMNCHQPHGSNHESLLVAARPYLCQQCHNTAIGHSAQFYAADQTAQGALLGGAASARVIGRSCSNCHSRVHGSNHPSGARLQR